MEQNRNEEIRLIIQKIITLLTDCGEVHWKEIITKINNQYICEDHKVEVAGMYLKILGGGMGSFMDLVLQKDDHMLTDENNKLD